MSDDYQVFDRAAVRRHRDRAAPGFDEFAFLHREVAARLLDRLDDIKRTFPRALDLGCHNGLVADALDGRGGVETLIQADISEAMARRTQGLRLVADAELLPLRAHSLDLVTSVLSLHWVNDLPGTLIQINRALKPDGLLLAAMFGGETLRELRQSLMEAEMEIEGGVSPRVSPFADIRDMGGLLQRAGFNLPVIDSDTITVTYDNPLKLMRDLRGMGESNAVIERRKGFTRRATLLRAAEIYHANFAGPDGRVPATFQILNLTAWTPHESQPRPKAPGSAKVSFTEILTGEEKDSGV